MPVEAIRAGSWIDPAFVSTSLDRSVAQSFVDLACVHSEVTANRSRRSCLLKIIEADGAHLAMASLVERICAQVGDGAYDDCEREVILQPGLEFVVLDAQPVPDSPWPAAVAPVLLTVGAVQA
jgi:hypothetical protein